MTNFPAVVNVTLQTLADTIFNAIRQPNGAVNAHFVDRLGEVVPVNSQLSGGQLDALSMAQPGREVEIFVRINMDGNSATAKIITLSPAGNQACIGVLDPTLLAGVTI